MAGQKILHCFLLSIVDLQVECADAHATVHLGRLVLDLVRWRHQSSILAAFDDNGRLGANACFDREFDACNASEGCTFARALISDNTYLRKIQVAITNVANLLQYLQRPDVITLLILH